MSCSGCASDLCSVCADRDITYVEAAPIPTPFLRMLGQDQPDGTQGLPATNYSAYDLFCLRTRLLPHLAMIDREIDATFLSYQEGDAMRLYICLLKRGDFIEVTEDQAAVLRGAVDYHLTRAPSYCLVYHVDLATTEIPKAWLRGVLPYVGPSKSDVQDDSYYDNGGLYVAIGDRVEYAMYWTEMCLEIEARLIRWYRQGICLLHPDLDHRLIADWKYEMIGEADGDEACLYRPTWQDSRFAPCPNSFILDRLYQNNKLCMQIGESLPRRHAIAKALNEIHAVFSFYRDQVGFVARDLDEALTIADIANESMVRLPRKAEAVVANNLDETVAMIKADNQGSDVTTYRAGDDIMVSYTL